MSIAVAAAPTALSRPNVPAPSPGALPGSSSVKVVPRPVPVLGVDGLALQPTQPRVAPVAALPFTDSPAFRAGQREFRNLDAVPVDASTGIPFNYLQAYIKAAHELKYGAGWEMLAAYASVESANGMYAIKAGHGLDAVIWDKKQIAQAHALGPLQFSPDIAKEFHVDPYNMDQSLGLLVGWMNRAGRRVVESGQPWTPRAAFEEMEILPPAAERMAKQAVWYHQQLPDVSAARSIPAGELHRISQEVAQAAEGLI